MRGNAPRPYLLPGLALLLGGGLLAGAAWLIIGYMPIVALGVAAILLGAVSLALSRTLLPVSPAASMVLAEAGFDNIAALVEELGLRARALYLPGSVVQGPPPALIPLDGAVDLPLLGQRVERRLIVRYGPRPEDFGVLVATPGSSALRLHMEASGAPPTDLEATLSAILVGDLDLARSVRVSRTERTVTVEVGWPALPWRNHPAYQVLGSPIASIVATVAAQTLDRPVRVVTERDQGRWRTVELELLEMR